MFNGLHFLHSKGISHSHIKITDILISEETLNIKIGGNHNFTFTQDNPIIHMIEMCVSKELSPEKMKQLSSLKEQILNFEATDIFQMSVLLF